MSTTLFDDDAHSRLDYPAIVLLIAGPVIPNLTNRYIGFLLGLSLVAVVMVHEKRRERCETEAPRVVADVDAT